MNTIKYILITLPALMLGACSGDEPVADDGGGREAIVSADVGQPQSRMNNYFSWEEGDRIGISGRTTSVLYDNVPYQANTFHNGDFTPVGNGIFLENLQMATFSAYYPYNAEVTATNPVISFSTADQSNPDELDYLYATGPQANKINPNINFTGDAAFRHSMAKLTLDFSPDDVELYGMHNYSKFYIDGIKTDGEFDTATGIATATSEPTRWYFSETTHLNVGYGNFYFRMYLFPQESDMTVGIEYEGLVYECKIPKDLEAGKDHRYTLKVKKLGMEINNISIADRVDGGSFNGNVKPK